MIATAALRIVHIGSTLYRGGVSTAVANLCRAQRDLGHRVWLVSDGGEAAESLAAYGVELCTVPMNGSQPVPLARSVPPVRRLLRAARPHVLHVHGRGPSLASLLAGRYPDWFTLHSTHLTEQVAPYDRGWVRRHLSPLGRSLFVLDPRAAAYCRDHMGVPAHRVQCVPNGVDCERFTPPTASQRARTRRSFGAGPSEVLVAYVGRFGQEKQPMAVVELARAARQADLGHVRFVLVGEGPLEPQVRAEVARSGLAETCQVRGWMDPVPLLQAADLLVMPSLFEGYGLVAAEALACGCPVLRSRTGGFEAMVREGVTGFGCEPDAADFVRVGLEVLRRSEHLGRMRGPAAAHARAHLSLHHQATRTIEAYRAAVTASRGGRSLRAVRCS
jgi:glycosyltransferase involved in cell wall biosynthesis